jgi:hypothetical protein
MAIKKRMAYSYEDDAGNRHSVIVKEARFGWIVTVTENGVEKRQSTEMGAMMTVLNDALVGHPR